MDLKYKNWRNFAKTFVSVLNLRGQPVSITYSDEEIQPTIKKSTEICEALKLANSGEILCLSEANLNCPGGRWHVGLGEKREGCQLYPFIHEI